MGHAVSQFVVVFSDFENMVETSLALALILRQRLR